MADDAPQSTTLAPSEDPTTRLDHIVRETWGHPAIRPLQRAAMEAVLARRDTLLILSTGGGKSLCYQAPALLLRGTTLVLSPLIALMKDQVDALRQAGVRAAAIHSASTPAERIETRRMAEDGALQLLYIAPERLGSEHFLDWIASRVPVSLLAVDEAHCISTWGHDFRPEYRQIAALRQRLGAVPVLACTATATPRVADDIAAQLRLSAPLRLVGSFDRPNFTYRVLPQKDSQARILAIIRRHPGQAGIVYCLSRKRTETLSANLARSGVRALPYHAGLDDATRHQNHEAFLAGDCDVMVATVAFGMGIDKPDIRFIVHIGIPESLENYQQETGRAGRDGRPAECTLLFSYGDVIMWRERASQAPGELGEILRNRLQDMIAYAEGTRCRRKTLLNHFGESHPGDCGKCDRCVPALADDGPILPTPRRPRGAAPAAPPRPPSTPVSPVDPDAKIPEKILSHFARARAPITPELAVDGLLGTFTDQTAESGHDQLSTFGLLHRENPEEVRYWIAQLLAFGCLEAAGGPLADGPTPLAVSRRGWNVMTGRESVALVRLPQPRLDPQSGAATPADNTLDEAAERLFETLRHWRLELARTRNVSAFVILSDNVLRAIAQTRPRTMDDLAKVPGIGQSRLQQYGPAILELLTAHQ